MVLGPPVTFGKVHLSLSTHSKSSIRKEVFLSKRTRNMKVDSASASGFRWFRGDRGL